MEVSGSVLPLPLSGARNEPRFMLKKPAQIVPAGDNNLPGRSEADLVKLELPHFVSEQYGVWAGVMAFKAAISSLAALGSLDNALSLLSGGISTFDTTASLNGSTGKRVDHLRNVDTIKSAQRATEKYISAYQNLKELTHSCSATREDVARAQAELKEAERQWAPAFSKIAASWSKTDALKNVAYTGTSRDGVLQPAAAVMNTVQKTATLVDSPFGVMPPVLGAFSIAQNCLNIVQSLQQFSGAFEQSLAISDVKTQTNKAVTNATEKLRAIKDSKVGKEEVADLIGSIFKNSDFTRQFLRSQNDDMYLRASARLICNTLSLVGNAVALASCPPASGVFSALLPLFSTIYLGSAHWSVQAGAATDRQKNEKKAAETLRTKQLKVFEEKRRLKELDLEHASSEIPEEPAPGKLDPSCGTAPLQVYLPRDFVELPDDEPPLDADVQNEGVSDQLPGSVDEPVPPIAINEAARIEKIQREDVHNRLPKEAIGQLLNKMAAPEIHEIVVQFFRDMHVPELIIEKVSGLRGLEVEEEVKANLIAKLAHYLCGDGLLEGNLDRDIVRNLYKEKNSLGTLSAARYLFARFPDKARLIHAAINRNIEEKRLVRALGIHAPGGFLSVRAEKTERNPGLARAVSDTQALLALKAEDFCARMRPVNRSETEFNQAEADRLQGLIAEIQPYEDRLRYSPFYPDALQEHINSTRASSKWNYNDCRRGALLYDFFDKMSGKSIEEVLEFNYFDRTKTDKYGCDLTPQDVKTLKRISILDRLEGARPNERESNEALAQFCVDAAWQDTAESTISTILGRDGFSKDGLKVLALEVEELIESPNLPHLWSKLDLNVLNGKTKGQREKYIEANCKTLNDRANAKRPFHARAQYLNQSDVVGQLDRKLAALPVDGDVTDEIVTNLRDLMLYGGTNPDSIGRAIHDARNQGASPAAALQALQLNQSNNLPVSLCGIEVGNDVLTDTAHLLRHLSRKRGAENPANLSAMNSIIYAAVFGKNDQQKLSEFVLKDLQKELTSKGKLLEQRHTQAVHQIIERISDIRYGSTMEMVNLPHIARFDVEMKFNQIESKAPKMTVEELRKQTQSKDISERLSAKLIGLDYRIGDADDEKIADTFAREATDITFSKMVDGLQRSVAIHNLTKNPDFVSDSSDQGTIREARQFAYHQVMSAARTALELLGPDNFQKEIEALSKGADAAQKLSVSKWIEFFKDVPSDANQAETQFFKLVEELVATDKVEEPAPTNEADEPVPSNEIEDTEPMIVISEEMA
ncbi:MULTISPECIES: hypothetical protein [unclassified Caballeronia]|uniref:hypothetical protein n=2 Tax=Caballeronia TaxID=1827195 RepID=UPI002028A1B3|nr:MULTISPECIES: hypothetical protein [unclassified Caballeronia]